MSRVCDNNLFGKNILFISLSGYEKGIIKQLKALGANVEYINDKPNDGVICKALGRLQLSFYQKILDKYYFDKINELRGLKFDYILVIRGEYTSIGALKRLKEDFPNAKLILYMWDSLKLESTRGIEQKWKYYDKVYTFDRIDYEANKDSISFLPLYYYDEYIPKDMKEPNSSDYNYDISFIGTGHADRIKIVKDVITQCNAIGKKTYSYFYMPNFLVYLREKLFNRNFLHVNMKDIHFSKISFETLYNTYSESRCVIDVEHPSQHGLTMRSIEIIGLKRKLITTNPDIINYDFYNPNNILIINRQNPVVDFDFFDKPYVYLPEEIYERYSLKNWVLNLLS